MKFTYKIVDQTPGLAVLGTGEGEPVRYSLAPILDFLAPGDLEKMPFLEYTRALKLLQGLAAEGGKGLKEKLGEPLPLVWLRYPGKNRASLCMSVTPPFCQPLDLRMADAFLIDALTVPTSEYVRKVWRQHHFEVHQKVRAKKSELADGRLVIEAAYQVSLPGESLPGMSSLEGRCVFYPAEFYGVMCLEVTEAEVDPSVRAEIESVIQSVHLLENDAPNPNFVPTAEAREDGLGHLAEPGLLELKFPAGFAVSKEMLWNFVEPRNRRLLWSFKHRDPEAAQISFYIEERIYPQLKLDVTPELVKILAGDETLVRKIQHQQSGQLFEGVVTGRTLTLADGTMALEMAHEFRMDGQDFHWREIDVTVARLRVVCLIFASAKVSPTTLADIETLLGSLRLYSGAKRIFIPARQVGDGAEPGAPK